MAADVTIAFFLDTRRPKRNKKCPVKLRVYHAAIQKKKLYSTQFEFSEKDFASIWETTKPRTEFKESRYQLQALENRALEVIKKIKHFSFEEFEKRMYTKKGDEVNVLYQFQKLVDLYKSTGRIGSYDTGKTSLKSIKEYANFRSGREVTKLHFAEITPEWLEKYEQYMITTKGKSKTTVGIYLRTLRIVFNSAIEGGYIEQELYPFGKKKYQIPATRNVKKALSRNELKDLYEATPDTKEQEKAKDFWFFSFACNGINIKDIALLRVENVDQDKIVLYRAKTARSSKADLKPVVIYLNDYSRGIIRKYGTASKNPKALVFDIISDGDSEETKHAKVKNFTRFINQNLQKLCELIGLPGDITTYWARHSYATNAIRNGASMEFVSEALNHKTTKTTQNYFAGFDNETKKEFAKTIMKFD